MTQQIVHEIRVALRPAQAFTRFVDDLGLWWPLAYTWSGARFATARIDSRVGGRWFETARDGEDKPWGEVRLFERGAKLLLSFNVGANRQPEPPERQSEVEIAFVPDGDGARIRIEHRDLDKHGDGAEAIRQGMGSEQGWPLILAEFEREIRRAG